MVGDGRLSLEVEGDRLEVGGVALEVGGSRKADRGWSVALRGCSTRSRHPLFLAKATICRLKPLLLRTICRFFFSSATVARSVKFCDVIKYAAATAPLRLTPKLQCTNILPPPLTAASMKSSTLSKCLEMS